MFTPLLDHSNHGASRKPNQLPRSGYNSMMSGVFEASKGDTTKQRSKSLLCLSAGLCVSFGSVTCRELPPTLRLWGCCYDTIPMRWQTEGGGSRATSALPSLFNGE